MRTLRAIAASVLVLGVAAGCSGNGDTKDTLKPDTDTSAPDALTPDGLAKAPKIKDGQGAVGDVVITNECPRDPGKNEVTGTVTNSADESLDYVITISWITERSDVVGRGFTTVKGLGAGETVDWKLTGSTIDAGNFSCSINVQRGHL